MANWLEDLWLAFGPDAKISINVDTFRSVTLAVDVERQASRWSMSKGVTWEALEHARSDPLASLAGELIAGWRLMQP